MPCRPENPADARDHAKSDRTVSARTTQCTTCGKIPGGRDPPGSLTIPSAELSTALGCAAGRSATGAGRSGHDPHPSALRSAPPLPGLARRSRAGGVRVGTRARRARLGVRADDVPGGLAVGAAAPAGAAGLRFPPGPGSCARPGDRHPAGGDPLPCRWSRGTPPVPEAAHPLRRRSPRGRPQRRPRWAGAGRRRRGGALRRPGRWPPRGLRRPPWRSPHHLRTGARRRSGGTTRRGWDAAGLGRRCPPRLRGGGVPALGSARRRGVRRPAHPAARPAGAAAALGGVVPGGGGWPLRDHPPARGVRTARSTACAAAARPGCAVGRPGTR